jgi:hypothetical protein
MFTTLTKVFTVIGSPLCNVGLETLVEVMGADASVDNSENDEYDGDDSKGGERFAGRDVDCLTRRLVHAYKFEEKVC